MRFKHGLNSKAINWSLRLQHVIAGYFYIFLTADICSQDMFSMKTTKGFSIMLGFLALACATLLGLYFWFIYLEQVPAYNPIVYNKDIRGTNLSVEQCPVSGARPGSRSHYPRPTTYSRCRILSSTSDVPLFVFFADINWYLNRGECACNPVHFFAILSMQRSGSGWFETLLNSHPNVSSNGEIFSVKQRRSNVSSVLSTLDEVYNLDWLSSASKNECSAAVGFKWMLNQVGKRYDTVRHAGDFFSIPFLFYQNFCHVYRRFFDSMLELTICMILPFQ